MGRMGPARTWRSVLSRLNKRFANSMCFLQMMQPVRTLRAPGFSGSVWCGCPVCVGTEGNRVRVPEGNAIACVIPDWRVSANAEPDNLQDRSLLAISLSRVCGFICPFLTIIRPQMALCDLFSCPIHKADYALSVEATARTFCPPLKRLLARSFIFPRRKNNPRPRLIGLPKTMKTPKMGRVNPAPSFFPKGTAFRGYSSKLYFAPICP